MKLPSEEIQRLLKTVVDHFDQEDRAVRERQIRTWRQLKLFWEGFQRLYYSEVAHDWRIFEEEREEDTDQSYYDKPVNVFRAYLESIIAALSVTVPAIVCFPDDADEPLDLQTAKAGNKISELIYRHNDVSLLWLHALFIFCTEGLTACYSYSKEDEKYGTYEKKQYEDVVEEQMLSICPECAFETEINLDEFRPEADTCPGCNNLVMPIQETRPITIERLVGITNHPKSRQLLEVYGGLYVKIPNWAMKQSDCPYLIFSYETHYANVIERYDHLHGRLKGGNVKSAGIYDPYEQWGRLSPQYHGEYPINNVTCRYSWLRHAAFNILDEDEAKKLKKEYPNGVKVVLVNDEFAEATPEALDDYWTLSYNPLSDYLHHDPLGLLLVSLQEITNDLISLTLQTIEHGIPQTFADPSVLNFDQYRQTEVLPGGVYPATARSGKTVSDGFHAVKTATLSGEILPFAENIQQMAQLVVGALPSLFGGSLEGTKTASEYSMSRAQALQRLQNIWKVFNVWWKNIFGKVIPAYIKDIKEDEHDVQQDDHGNFFNVFIRRAELEGKIGRIEIESSESLPITWAQQRDIILELMKAGTPEILAMLMSPENLPLLRRAIGLTEFHVPGEEDRNKQYEEIKLLLNSEPIISPETEEMLPSVEVEPEIDNHQIEFMVCREWLISSAGRLAKTENQVGYQNIVLHAYAHLMFIRQAQMMQGAASNEKPNEQSGAPIQEESDVPITQ